MASKKIGYLTSEYPAISHTFILREVEELRRRGVSIETFSVRPARASGVITETDRRERDQTFALLNPPYRELLRNNVSAIRNSPLRFLRAAKTAYDLRTKGARGFLKWAAYLAEGVSLGTELERRGVQHLHNHFANSSANVAMLASSYSGIPFSFTLHGLAEVEWPDVGPLQDKLSRAAFLVTICEFNRSQTYRMTSTEDWSKVNIVRCGLDLSQFPQKLKRPRDAGPIRVLCVARLDKEKGIPGLIEAFSQVVSEGLDAHLDLIGDGPERDAVERQIRELRLQERVTLHGRKAGQDVRDAFVRADICAMSSLIEGLPIVLMEAMATGTPVIAPTIAGIPELVTHERTGLLYTPSNWGELAGCITRLAKDESLRERLVEGGRKKVEEQHDIKRAVIPLLELFGVQGLGSSVELDPAADHGPPKTVRVRVSPPA
jgi:colanic acid/amylovoran biosynthesis glycosyltransferase